MALSQRHAGEELKALISARDVRGILTLMFVPGKPQLREGFFHESELWDFKVDCPSISKSNEIEWAKIASDVAAFHNREGGVLIFGIRNHDFKYVGTREYVDTKHFNDKIRKYVGDRFWVSFSREFPQMDQTYLGIAIVPPRSVTHVRMLRDSPKIEDKVLFRAGDLCIRIGDQTRILRGSQAIEYAATKGLGASAATFAVDEPNYRILRPDYKHFTNRAGLSREIEKAIKSPRTYVTSLTGIGGVGKTALACWTTLKAYEAKLFDFIVSVSARDRALTSSGIVATDPTFSSLDDLLREICDTTGFTEYSEIPDETEKLEVIQRDILSQFNGLLFVDNLETVDDARILTFLESLPLPTRAIVTSRRAKIRIANFPVEIGPFDQHEAILFLDETSNAVGKGFFTEMARAEKELIVNSCDRIPLVIEWLIGRSRDEEKALNLAENLDAHGKHGDELLEYSFRHIYEEMTGSQRSVLQAISLINQPLPIEAVAVASGLPIHSAADVLEELKDYSLVERVYDGNFRDLVYSLLPVTSTFVYREMKKQPGKEADVRKRLSGWYQASDIQDLNQRSLVQQVRRGERQPELTLLQIARNYLAQGFLDNAEEYFKQALDRNPRNWQVHRELGEFYRHQRREVASALRHYGHAAEFSPKQGPERAKIFREFGIILRSSGMPNAFSEAADKLQIALKESPTDPICRHALGDCLVKMMHYDVAIKTLKPLEDSPSRETRIKTYPLLEACYRSTNRMLELQYIREKIIKGI